jgi:hypothetical protein
MVNVSYSYEHPEFDPVVVSVTSPVATVGYTQRVSDRLTLSGVVFPSQDGKETIPGLPRKVDGTMEALAVESQDQVIDAGLGAAYRPREDLSLGVSLVHTVENHSLKASTGSGPADLVDLSYHNQFDRPVAGIRYEHGHDYGKELAVSFAVRPELVKRYKGSETLAAGAGGSTAPKVQDYDPTTASLGVGGGYRGAFAGVEAQRQFWAKGRGVVKDGISADLPQADLRDITQTSVTAGYALHHGPKMELGFADLPSPWGNGRDDGVLADHVAGVGFGQLDGLDRRVYSGAVTTRLLGSELSFGVARTTGKREVGSGGDNVGYYELDVTTVSSSIRKAF